MHEWAFYDLECRTCGTKGLVGVWKETQMGKDVWNGEWQRFLGVVDRRKGLLTETLRCGDCLSADVIAVMREHETATRA